MVFFTHRKVSPFVNLRACSCFCLSFEVRTKIEVRAKRNQAPKNMADAGESKRAARDLRLAAGAGDLETIRKLLDRHPSLIDQGDAVRCFLRLTVLG